MKLNKIMTEQVKTIDVNESAGSAWSRMQDLRIRHLVVTENNELAGVISERDLGGKSGSETRRGHTVRDLMTKKVATADPDMTLRQAANLMRGRLIGSLPVLEGDRLVGIVTATDVLDALGRGASRPEGLVRRPPAQALMAKKKEVAAAN
jgi:acetoin utilization protein AcuB